jgi:methoxymalonate biosynthesis acyl carrier protein
MPPRDAIRSFLARFFRGHVLRDDDDIFALGFVNSLFAMKLVTFIETELGVAVEQSDLDIANFRTVDAMVAFVERRREAAHGAAPGS